MTIINCDCQFIVQLINLKSNQILKLWMGVCLSFLFDRLQYLETAHERLVDDHHSGCVIEFSAIIRRGENRDQLALGEKFVTVLDNLMGAAHEIQIVLSEERLDHVVTESERDTAIVLSPANNFLFGIRPEKIAQQTGIGDIGWARNTSDLVHVVQFGRETTMHAENLFIDNGRNRKCVEHIGERFPQFNVVSSLALIVKTVDTRDGRAFVVSAEQEEILWVEDFVTEE